MKVGAARILDYKKTLSEAYTFDHHFDMVVILDCSENVVYANRAFLIFTQTDNHQIKKGLKFSECMKLDYGEDESVFVQCSIHKKHIGVREVLGHLKNETEISAQIGAQPLFTGNHLGGYLVNIQDKSLELNLHNKYKDLIQQLEEGFDQTIRSFINIVDMVEDNTNFHNQKVSTLSVKIAQQLNLSESEIRVIESAARLHDIGKIGMSAGVFTKSIDEMTEDEKNEYMKHPEMGVLIFRGIPIFQDICALIRSHHEFYDGRGFPDGLAGDKVPLGSYIIGLADEYIKLCERTHDIVSVSLRIQKYSGLKYHPMVVDAFLEVVQAKEASSQVLARKHIDIEDLKIGMVFAEKLNTKKGLLLVMDDEDVTQGILDRIHSYYENDLIAGPAEIFVPMSSDEVEANKIQKEKNRESEDTQVLIVEDMPDLNMIFCESIEDEEGFSATGVFNGQEALDALEEHSYDIVMIDMMMPVMDGITTVKNIRDRGLTIPIVMCTSIADHDIVIKAFKNGADDYLVKPIVKEDIFNCFETTILKRTELGDNFREVKALRDRQMLMVLEQVAPNLIAEMRKGQTRKTYPVELRKSIRNKKTGRDEDIEFDGEVITITKRGFELKTKQYIEDKREFSFVINNLGRNKSLSGMARMAFGIQSNSDDEEYHYYQIQFLDIVR